MSMNVDSLIGYLKSEDQASAALLFTKVVEKARGDIDYRLKLANWMSMPSTVELRNLVEGFGDYWKDRDFQNDVDEIDSASLHLRSDASYILIPDLRAARTCIAQLLARLDHAYPGMHTQGQTPGWYVEAAAISTGRYIDAETQQIKSGATTAPAALPEEGSVKRVPDHQTLKKVGTEPVTLDASCHGDMPDICVDMGIWVDASGDKWAKIEGDFTPLLPGNRLQLKPKVEFTFGS